MRRRDEPHRKAEFQQLSPPVMRRGAGLHRHDAPRKRVEKLQKRSAIDRAGNDDRARRVDRVNAEDPLGQIKPDARDRRGIDDRLAHGRPPFQMALSTTTILARLMPFGAPSTPSAKGQIRGARQAVLGRPLLAQRRPKPRCRVDRVVLIKPVPKPSPQFLKWSARSNRENWT